MSRAPKFAECDDHGRLEQTSLLLVSGSLFFLQQIDYPEREAGVPYLNCPECGREQLVQREMVGLVVRCQKCREEFRATEPQLRPSKPKNYQETKWPLIFGA